MRYQALAADYDGTLATEGVVDEATVAALERFAATGRRLVLVTGRELDELIGVFPNIGMFHRVVAENGALLYTPETQAIRLLAPEPPQPFVDELKRRGVSPLSVGRSIVATLVPNETIVLEVIRELGLELHVVFNKGSVMVLPASVNKATGLAAALEELALSRHNVVAVGDGENDHALLAMAELGVAVANAVPMLKDAADRTTTLPRGAGVAELLDDVVATDLAREAGRAARHRIAVGSTAAGEPITVPPSLHMLVIRPAPPAKPVFSPRVVERAQAAGYQTCVVVPHGEPQEFGAGVVFGTTERLPAVAEIAAALEQVNTNVIVSLTAAEPDARLVFFRELATHLRDLAKRLGRPHILVLDEAHELLDERHFSEFASSATAVLMATSRPDALSADLVNAVGTVVAVGDQADEALELVAQARGITPPPRGSKTPGDDALLWTTPDQAPIGLRFDIVEPSRR